MDTGEIIKEPYDPGMWGAPCSWEAEMSPRVTACSADTRVPLFKALSRRVAKGSSRVSAVHLSTSENGTASLHPAASSSPAWHPGRGLQS